MAEGGGLLNRCTGSTRTVSSNLIPSAKASLLVSPVRQHRLFAGALAVALSISATSGAVTPDRTRLNRILTVLRLKPDEASSACITSMRAVHHAEGPGADPAQTEFAYENASQMCGVDAVRLCHNALTSNVSAPCAALELRSPPE